MPELVINDSNWQEHAPTEGWFFFDGEWRVCNGVRPSVPMATLPGVHLIGEDDLIPRDQWDDHIARKDREKSWLYDKMVEHEIPCKDQDGLGYCWVYGMTSCAELVRVVQRHPFIELSPESLGGPIVNWRNEGGMPDWAITGYRGEGGLRDVGVCRQGFAKRQSLRPSTWDRRWKADRENFRCPEFTDFDLRGRTFDAAVTAALMNIPTCAGFSWWLHAFIYGLKIRKRNGRYEIMGRNSWGPNYGEDGFFWLAGSKAVPDLDIIGPRVITPYDG